MGNNERLNGQPSQEEINAEEGAVVQEVDVDSTEILTTTTENVLRQDMVVGVSLDDQKKLINQAPETKDNLVKTKPVF